MQAMLGVSIRDGMLAGMWYQVINQILLLPLEVNFMLKFKGKGLKYNPGS